MTAAASRARQALPPEVTDQVRRSVRGVLEKTPAYAEAGEAQRRELARGLVDLGLVAAGLIDTERKSEERLRERPRGVVAAQAAGDQLGLQATRAAAGTLTGLRDAIDFPTYVGSLITGVFQAILGSSAQQLGSLSDLVENVGVSADDYASSVDDAEVARWLVAKLPRLLRSSQGDGVEAAPGVDLEEHDAEIQRVVGGGADPSDPDSLIESARRKMAQDKQATMATMIQMGLQRIVVDEGRIHASMDLRVDATSASQEAAAQRNDWRVSAGASGQFGIGPWAASASASTSIGQVRSDAQLTSEQIGARAGLRSSVDLAFRTDQVPLDRVASRSARAHLDSAARGVDVGGQTSVLPAGPSNFAAPSLDVSAQVQQPAAPTPPTPVPPPPGGQRPPPAAGTPPPPAGGTPPPGAPAGARA